jgi:hypothetical protein
VAANPHSTELLQYVAHNLQIPGHRSLWNYADCTGHDTLACLTAGSEEKGIDVLSIRNARIFVATRTALAVMRRFRPREIAGTTLRLLP